MNLDLKPGLTPEVTDINVVQHVLLYAGQRYLDISVMILVVKNYNIKFKIISITHICTYMG